MNWYKKAAGERVVVADYDRDRAERASRLSENPFASWFPNGKTRDFFPLVSAEEAKMGPGDEDVVNFLKRNGYNTEPRQYVDGITTSPNGRPIRIGKVLRRLVDDETARLTEDLKAAYPGIHSEDEAERELAEAAYREKLSGAISNLQYLLRDFVNSPLRQSKGRQSVWVAISRDPHDIATMSHGRSWTSCMDVEGGGHGNDVWKEIEAGSLVAYAIRDGDWEIKRPLARIHIKRFQDNEGRNVALPEKTVYGEEVNGFAAAVGNWLDQHQDGVKAGVYKRVGGEYSDTYDDHHIVLPDDPAQLLELVRNGIDESEYTRYKVMSIHPEDVEDTGISYDSDDDGIEIASFKTQDEAMEYINASSEDDNWRNWYGEEWEEHDDAGNYYLQPYRIEKEQWLTSFRVRFNAAQKLSQMPAGSVPEDILREAYEIVKAERGKNSTWASIGAALGSKIPGLVGKEDFTGTSPSVMTRMVEEMPEGPDREQMRDLLEQSVKREIDGLVERLGKNEKSISFHRAYSEFSASIIPLSSVSRDTAWDEEHQPSPETVSSVVSAAKWLMENGPGLPEEKLRYGVHAMTALTRAKSDLPDVVSLIKEVASRWVPIEEEVPAASRRWLFQIPSIQNIGWSAFEIGDAGRQFLPLFKKRLSELQSYYNSIRGKDPKMDQAAMSLWQLYMWSIDSVESGRMSSKYRYSI